MSEREREMKRKENEGLGILMERVRSTLREMTDK